MKNITLSVLTDPDSGLFHSEINIINATGERLYNSVITRDSELNLGDLSNLKDAEVIVQTSVAAGIGATTINYTVSYGGEDTETWTHRLGIGTWFDSFKFKFCPRFPFY